MSEQYWVGGFFIDVSRNQITQNQQSQTLAPKALAVLTYLAEHRGKVVSHDELLDNIWRKTVVSPNTLQRSIAQLRKALGDDGKVYIKTHAKQGYSLECDVRWEAQKATPVVEETSTQAPTKDVVVTDTSGLPTTLMLIALVLLACVGLWLVTIDKPTQLTVGEMRLLTTTDDKELASIYSPDGKYVVFHRFSDAFCLSHIWAKNMETQEEIQLTKDLDAYGRHSFSKDGKKLAFIQSGGCHEPAVQKKCYKLMSIAFDKALESPQSPKVMVECKNSHIRDPKWLNNDNIALLQNVSGRWKLVSYSIADNKSHDLYEVEEGNIIDYDYSAEKDLIALTSFHRDDKYYIDVLSSVGEVLSSHPIVLPPEIASNRLIGPNFSHIDEQLIFSTGRQLFTLSYDGKVSNISLPLDEPMGSPIFHPNGQKMLVIKGYYDSDVGLIAVADLARPVSDNITVIERSTFGDDNAKLQPGGELLAYESGRSGEQQVWLTDGNGSQQLTHFPMDTYINGTMWADDGRSLLVNASHVLSHVSLDGEVKPLDLEHAVIRLFHWDSVNDTAIVSLRVKGIPKFGEIDLTQSTFRPLQDKPVNWAVKSENGMLVYTDEMDRFWIPGPAEDQRIAVLDEQGSDKRFVIKNNVIYGVNEDYQLWSYSLLQKTFSILGELPTTVDYLTDIDANQLLVSLRISSRKEVAELSLND